MGQYNTVNTILAEHQTVLETALETLEQEPGRKYTPEMLVDNAVAEAVDYYTQETRNQYRQQLEHDLQRIAADDEALYHDTLLNRVHRFWYEE